MKIIPINKAVILYNTPIACVTDYYNYIISVLKSILLNNNLSINIVLNYKHHISPKFNNNKTINIGINYEHTLVKRGGRSVLPNTPIGQIIYGNNNKYFVRIDNINQYTYSNIIIDYSNPNIFNVRESNLFNNFADKHIYIAPSIYETLYIIKTNRNINVLTTFININEPRRKKLLNNIKIKKIDHQNRSNCFNKTKLQELYRNTKILINIHQTGHHDTFEELRVLPALTNGVIIVSEKSPLNKLIPYNDLIIWTDYNNILDTVNDIINNYDEYYNTRVFTDVNIRILEGIKDINYKCLEEKIIQTLLL